MIKHPVLFSIFVVVVYLYYRQEIDRMQRSIKILQFNLKKFNERITKLETRNQENPENCRPEDPESWPGSGEN